MRAREILAHGAAPALSVFLDALHEQLPGGLMTDAYHPQISGSIASDLRSAKRQGDVGIVLASVYGQEVSMNPRWLDILRKHGKADLGESIVRLARLAASVHHQQLNSSESATSVPLRLTPSEDGFSSPAPQQPREITDDVDRSEAVVGVRGCAALRFPHPLHPRFPRMGKDAAADRAAHQTASPGAGRFSLRLVRPEDQS